MLARHWSLLPALVVFGLLALTPAAGAAQDCGELCLPCGIDSVGGEDNGGYGWYTFDCVPDSQGCEVCLRQVGGAARLADEVLGLVEGASVGALRGLAEKYRDNLVLEPTRGVLAFREARCNPETPQVTAVVFLTRERAQALQALNVAQLK